MLTDSIIIVRPGRSQGLLYKHHHYLLMNRLGKYNFLKVIFWRLQAQTIRDFVKSLKIDYVAQA